MRQVAAMMGSASKHCSGGVRWRVELLLLLLLLLLLRLLLLRLRG